MSLFSVLDVTTGREVTVLLEDDGLETVDSVLSKIERELGRMRGIAGDQRISVTSVGVGDQYRCIDRHKSIDYYLIDGCGWLVQTSLVQKTVSRRPSSPRTGREIFVIGPGVQMITSVNATTVSELRSKAADRIALSPHDLRLIYAGRQLENGKTLADYSVYPNSFVHLVLSLPGGGPALPASLGVQFVDVDNTGGLKRRQWSKSAPPWRIAKRGLCLEGVCQNSQCKANGKKVIMNRGLHQFDLIEERHTCHCPVCDEQVIPTTCGFNNCWWSWTGRKVDMKTGPQRVEGDWKKADDAYHHFDETKSGVANWLRLKFTVKELTLTPEICAICYESRSHPDQSLPRCGHKFHRKCFAEWSKRSSTCPVCRASSIMTPFMRSSAGL